MAILTRPPGLVLRWPRWGIAAVSIALLCAGSSFAQKEQEKSGEFLEYDIKAAYLVNFAKYVEWPEDAFENAESPIKLGILGVNPFGDALTQLAASQEIGGRKLQLEKAEDVAPLQACHIIFFAASETRDHAEDLAGLDELPILVVGEKKGFVDKGGVINFVIVDTKVKFEINLKAAKRKKLKINSQLLKLSTKVYK